MIQQAKPRDLLRAAAILVLLGAIWWAPSAHPANGGAAASQSPWGRDYFPNVRLVTHEGRTVRFFDDLIKGKVVAINFIFTGCSASCSMETARLRQVQDLLSDRVGKDVFFYSISVDPDNDTPEALKHYAAKFDVGPGWTFLTGRKPDIDLLQRKLGLYIPPAAGAAQGIDHDISVVIGNQATGRWMKASPMEHPEVLATRIGSWLHNWKVRPARENPSYAEAPTRLPQLTRGEELFRTRCMSCHSVAGTPYGASARPLGPDLAGVTRSRDRNWLVRWLKEPDVMLAQKDPLATALFEQWNRVPMPNLKLNAGEIEHLLSWLEQVDAAVASK